MQHFFAGMAEGADAGAAHDNIGQGAGHFVAYSIRDLGQNLAIGVDCFGQAHIFTGQFEDRGVFGAIIATEIIQGVSGKIPVVTLDGKQESVQVWYGASRQMMFVCHAVAQ